jgi:hypothetical protein
MPLAWRFAFLTVGCPATEGVRNRRAVARSFLGLVCMTRGAWPPCHKVGSLVHAEGDFTRDASGARVWGSSFKKGSISRAVDMSRSSCDHRTLSPSRPPDGVRRCSLEGSASRPSLSTISPSESVRSWWYRRSCLLAAVGGVQPHGSLHPSTIIRLQGFSSCSPAAVPRRWSSRRMTTSLVVGRSKPGCGLPPALSFKDVHHPCWGGGCAELGPHLRVGSGPLLPSVFEGEGRSPALRRRRTLGARGQPFVAPSAAACLAPWPGWLWCRLRCCLLPLGWSMAGRPPYGRRSCRPRVGHIHGFSRAAGRTRGLYKTSYAAGAATAFLDGFVLTPAVRTGAKTSSCTLVQPLPIGAEVVAATGGTDVVASAGEAAHCRGGCLRWRDRQCHMLPDLRPFGFNGLAVTPVGGRGRGPIRSSAHPEVIAAAGEPLGAEVIVAAGAEVVTVIGGTVRSQLPARLLLVQCSSFLQKWS